MSVFVCMCVFVHLCFRSNCTVCKGIGGGGRGTRNDRRRHYNVNITNGVRLPERPRKFVEIPSRAKKITAVKRCSYDVIVVSYGSVPEENDHIGTV